MSRPRLAARLLIGLVVLIASVAHAGSSEPKLAIAEATASSDTGVVSVEILGNFDYDNAVRLGYPLSVLVTQGTSMARMLFDGRVGTGDAWTDLSPPAETPGAPGVIAIGPERLTVVLPSSFTPGGTAALRLEALFVIDGNTTSIRSNAVEVTW
jgi:hypothetical protein